MIPTPAPPEYRCGLVISVRVGAAMACGGMLVVRRPARFCFASAFRLEFVLRSLVNIPRQVVGTESRGSTRTRAPARIHNVGGSELIASPSQHLTRHRCCQTVHSNTRGQTIAAVPSLGSDILRRAGFAIQVNQGWILADERYCVQGRTHNPAVQHHADAQPTFRGTTLRLAFGHAKISRRPKQNVGFSD